MNKVEKQFEIYKLGVSKLKEHALYERGWRFDFNNRKNDLGLCHIGKKTIFFSKTYIDIDQDEILDTILHEIAHAIDYEQRGTSGHDSTWKAVAKRVGARPERVAEVEIPNEYKWQSYCEKCNEALGGVHRRGKCRHKGCGGSVGYKLNE